MIHDIYDIDHLPFASHCSKCDIIYTDLIDALKNIWGQITFECQMLLRKDEHVFLTVCA